MQQTLTSARHNVMTTSYSEAHNQPEPDLPVQCKGVVELNVGVGHGVKGRELLQSLHQLHNGLVILDDKMHVSHQEHS